jgi:predicted esterase
MTRSMRTSDRGLAALGRVGIAIAAALGLLASCGDGATETPSIPGATAGAGAATTPVGASAMMPAMPPAGTAPPSIAPGGAAVSPMPGMSAMPPTPALPPGTAGSTPMPAAMPPSDMPADASQTAVDRYEPWEPVCPDGFTPSNGMNTGFESDGAQRQFSVFLPSDVSSPRPVFISLTGTEQTESGFMTQAGVNALPGMGFIVLAPVRTCATARTNCNGWGDNLTMDGRLWEPWFDGSSEEEFRQDEGPDVRFFEAMVKCAATAWDIDQKKIYLGGISAGGTITNRNMTFNSDFFAGGVNASGAWYSVVGSIRPQPAAEVEDEREGWCCPRPFHSMDSSIVINIWGGTRDTWANASAMPAVDVDFGPETKRAAAYYASQENVLTVSCSGGHGHQWPSAGTAWFATTLLSFPKGSDPASFQLTTPPTGLTCVIGEYDDH